MNRFAIAAALAMSALSTSPALAADTVSVVSGTRGVTIASNGPVGQTFTATDSQLTNFGFQFASSINGQTTAMVTFSLLQGAGTTGTVLATQTVSVAGLVFRGTSSAFFNVFTGSANLVTGQMYTALLSGASSNLALLFGPSAGQTTDAYVPGVLLQNNPLDQACNNNNYCDANFRFTAVAAASPVPEPATWGMMLVGFGMLGASARYRRGAAKVAFSA